MTEAEKLKLAEDYACVEFVGLNPHGERMYQAKNFYDLAKRDVRIPAFLAGLEARPKLTDEILEEAARCVYQGLQELGVLKDESDRRAADAIMRHVQNVFIVRCRALGVDRLTSTENGGT